MAREGLEFHKLLRDPKATFGTPERVLADPRLDREGKRAILRIWERNARELTPADEENAAARDEPAMLDRVRRALARIPGENECRPRQTSTRDAGAGEESSRADEAQPASEVRAVMREVDEIVHLDHDLYEAYGRMRRLEQPILPVADGDEVVGVLTARDIYEDARGGADERLAKKVRDYVSTDISFCYDSDSLDTARIVMEDAGHHRLLVIDAERQLVGIVTLEAVTAALRLHGKRHSRGKTPKFVARHVKSPGRAKGDRPGQPETFAVRPKIKS